MKAEPEKPAPVAKAGNWADLRTRVVSGVVLAVVGLGLMLSSGPVLCAGLSVLVGLMFWELAGLTGDTTRPRTNARNAWLIGGLAGLAFAGAALLSGLLIDGIGYGLRWASLPLLVPLGWGCAASVPRNRWPFLLFGVAIFAAAAGIVLVRSEFGLAGLLWIVGTVVLSDVLGYFAGRRFGGPKFWPAISPKKTWSGTIAGWIGAFLLALLVVLISGAQEWYLLIVGPLIAFSGQMGDIAESWLKRRAGVKDSSNLIPGHGGVLDRFDAMTGAFVVPALVYVFVLVPLMLFAGVPQG